MKKTRRKPDRVSDEPLPEYDFSDGVRGKYYKAYRKGHTVSIHETDGSVTTHYFGPQDGSVMLDPDVRKYFRNSETVNKALRSLIASRISRRTPPRAK